MAAGAVRLGDMLVKAALITREQLNQALQQQQTGGGRIGANLVKLGFISEDDITSFLSRQYGVPSINLSHFEIDATVIKLIPSEIAQKHQVIPINRTGNVLTVAMADPSNIFAIDDIKFMTGFKVEPVVAAETSIKNSINKYYDSAGLVEDIMKGFDDKDVEALREEDDNVNAAELGKAAEDAPVVKLVNLILTDAIKKGASDIHIEPYEKSFRVRYRIDGMLYDVMQPPTRLKAAITSRIKIMAQLDIAERRLPQDGRIKIKMAGKEMDFRVSTLPTLFGEKVVMRLLDKGNLQLDMTKLGFESRDTDRFRDRAPDALRHGPGDRPDRVREDHHALLGAEPPQHGRHQHHDRRGSGGVQPPRHQPGADQGRDRPDLRRGPALLPPAGPGHHHGGGDPRLRDGRDRGQGRPHRATWCCPRSIPTTPPAPSAAS